MTDYQLSLLDEAYAAAVDLRDGPLDDLEAQELIKTIPDKLSALINDIAARERSYDLLNTIKDILK